MTLLVIIFLESLFSYLTLAENSSHLRTIITVDEVKLRAWYDIAEIITNAKDRLYDYRLGRTELMAPVDLLVNKAIAEMNSIKELAADKDEIDNVNEIVEIAKKLKESIYAYETEVRQGYPGDPSARKMEAVAIRMADSIANLGRGAAAYVSERIAANNEAILEATIFSQKMLAFVLFIAIIATIIVSFILARVLARPIEELVNGAEKLASGDLAYRVNVGSDDEIGQLAKRFNFMAEQLHKFRQSLLASKAYTDNIIKSMINSLVVVNRDVTIREANQATLDMLGYTEEELIGKPFSIVFAEGYYNDIGLEELVDKGFARNIETTFKTKNGRKIRVLFSGALIFDDEGNFEGIVCVAQDITIQTEALRAGHLASIGELAAGVAHEINNPINGIINFAQIMIDELDKGGVPDKEIPAMIIKEGDRVATIVRSLLSFAREGENVMKLISLHEILDEVLALAEAQIHKDGINLTVDVPMTLPVIRGNFQQIQQVFLNIINNARYALNKKYPGSNPNKNILIQGREEIVGNRPMVRIVFRDQGTGIPAHLIDKVMNPFFSTKPAGTGTGLGLAISHGIISSHEGKLTIESDEGQYTMISILLPINVESNG